MGLSMICIMLYHQNWVSGDPLSDWMHILGYLGVEVFLLISGFGIASSLSKNTTSKYFYNRLIRLMPACVIYGIIKIACSLIPSMPQLSNIILELFSIMHWYIYAIVIYYLIAPILYKAVFKFGWHAFIAIIMISYVIVFFWQADPEAPYLLKYGRWIVKRLPVFVLGITITLKPLNWKIQYTVFLGLIAFTVNLICLRYVIMANAYPSQSSNVINLFTQLPNRYDIPDNGLFLLNMLSVLFLCPLFSWIAQITSKFRIILSTINWLGFYSLEIYLCHQYIFKICDYQLQLFPILELVIAVLIVIAVAYIIKLIANRIQSIITNNIVYNVN